VTDVLKVSTSGDASSNWGDTEELHSPPLPISALAFAETPTLAVFVKLTASSILNKTVIQPSLILSGSAPPLPQTPDLQQSCGLDGSAFPLSVLVPASAFRVEETVVFELSSDVDLSSNLCETGKLLSHPWPVSALEFVGTATLTLSFELNPSVLFRITRIPPSLTLDASDWRFGDGSGINRSPEMELSLDFRDSGTARSAVLAVSAFWGPQTSTPTLSSMPNASACLRRSIGMLGASGSKFANSLPLLFSSEAIASPGLPETVKQPSPLLLNSASEFAKTLAFLVSSEENASSSLGETIGLPTQWLAESASGIALTVAIGFSSEERASLGTLSSLPRSVSLSNSHAFRTSNSIEQSITHLRRTITPNQSAEGLPVPLATIISRTADELRESTIDAGVNPGGASASASDDGLLRDGGTTFSSGAIVGIIIAALVLLALIVGLVLVAKSRAKSEHSIDTGPNSTEWHEMSLDPGEFEEYPSGCGASGSDGDIWAESAFESFIVEGS
jgi:hypothetical protein